MSSELLGAAFKADIKPHAYKLVMLKLIDAARDDGTKIYPSIKTIAKAAGVSERHTKRVLHGFVEIGLLSITVIGGKGRGDTTEYSMDLVLLAALGTSVRVTFENGKGTIATKGDTASLSQKRVTSETVKGDTGVTQPLSEPLDWRENARVRGQMPAAEVGAKPRFEFLPPPEERIRATFEALAAAWQQGAKGGRGAIGNSNKARSAIADLPDADHEIAIERAPRFLRALKAASRHPLSIENYILGREFDHHPPPKGIDPAVVQPIELMPYSVPLWMMVWNAIDPVGKNHLPTDRVKYFLARIVKGLVTPASALPKADDDVARLVPVKIGSPNHADWVSHCENLGFRLPKPDAVPVVYVPTQTPPNLKSTWKGYRLALPQRLIFRSVAWWWRLHRIDEGAIIEAQLREAGSSQGAVMIDMGPWPSSVELAGMVQIERLSDQFRAWARWFDTKGIYLDLWPESSIWCPSEYPPLNVTNMKELAS